jgi:hypothetical protein
MAIVLYAINPYGIVQILEEYSKIAYLEVMDFIS